MRMMRMICMTLAVVLCLGAMSIPAQAAKLEDTTPAVFAMELSNTRATGSFMRKYQLIFFLIALMLALSGCARHQKEMETSAAGSEMPSTVHAATNPDESTNPQPLMQFSVAASENPGYRVISQEELGGNTDAYLAYYNLAEVNLLLDGGYLPLPEAIRRGNITVPEIFAFARMDSQNGFCEETYQSEHGLAHFSYTYPECELLLAYDVLETPSGDRQLIEEIYICAGSDNWRNQSHFYVDENSEWGYFVDREDWGLDFEVSSASPTQIVLDVTQQGGQQMGELVIEHYYLFSKDKNTAADEKSDFIGQAAKDAEGLPIPILMDASGQITIDWSAAVGTLNAGNYYVKLIVSDSYDQLKVHPLMVNYYDKQGYNIAFEIP